MTIKDVISVENARKLKRAGIKQESKAFWRCIIASLSNIEGLAVAKEEKTGMRWVLVLGKPEDPSASAFTLEELEAIFKEKFPDKELPIFREEDGAIIGSTKERDLFITKTKQDNLALTILLFSK